MIPVVVINLARSSDRRAAMEQNFTQLGRPLRFFNAVDARTMTDEEIAILSPTVYVGHGRRDMAGHSTQ